MRTARPQNWNGSGSPEEFIAVKLHGIKPGENIPLNFEQVAPGRSIESVFVSGREISAFFRF